MIVGIWSTSNDPRLKREDKVHKAELPRQLFHNSIDLPFIILFSSLSKNQPHVYLLLLIHMAATLFLRPNRAVASAAAGSSRPRPPARRSGSAHVATLIRTRRFGWGVSSPSRRALFRTRAGSRADDSAPFEMSVESALKLLGVSEGASFDDILRAKNSIVKACKDNQEAIAQVLFCAAVAVDWFFHLFDIWSIWKIRMIFSCVLFLGFSSSFF